MIDLFRYTKNWMTQNTRPTPPWLKLSQISNFLTGVGSPGSEWSKKVSKLSIQPCLASESSKPFSKKALFFDIVQQI